MLSTVEIVELEKKLARYRLKKRLYYVVFVALVALSILAAYLVDIRFFRTMPVTPNPVIGIDANQTLLSAMPEEDKNKTAAEENTTEAPSSQSNNDVLLLKLPTIVSNSTASSMAKKTYSPPPAEDFDTPTGGASGVTETPLNNRLSMRKPTESNDNTFYRAKDEQIDGALLPPPLPSEEVKPKGYIKIESHEVNSISYLKDKFDTTHNIIFAIMLAEEYYTNKNYSECNKWALIANNIDAENEKSWIWFAKSKVKLGQKNDAILALKTYLKSNKSQSIQSLLNQIMVGEPIN